MVYCHLSLHLNKHMGGHLCMIDEKEILSWYQYFQLYLKFGCKQKLLNLMILVLLFLYSFFLPMLMSWIMNYILDCFYHLNLLYYIIFLIFQYFLNYLELLILALDILFPFLFLSLFHLFVFFDFAILA